MKAFKLLKRFMVPSWLTSLIYFFRFRAKISPKAEIELSSNVKMGKGCSISSFTKLKAGNGIVHFGKRCGFAMGCYISSGVKGISVGDNIVCGPNVIITGSSYIYE